MSIGFNALPPRAQGVAAIAIAAGVAIVGVLVARMLGDEFYPVFFPMSGFVVGLGVFQVVTGYSRDQIQHRQVPAPWNTAMLMLNVVGIGAGLLLNQVLYGAWW